MKTLIYLLTVLLTLNSYAQKREFVTLLSKYESKLATYCNNKLKIKKKAVSDSVFTADYRKVFSTIVLGSSDVVQQGSAMSYSQDNNKNTFSVNGTFSIPQKSQRWFLNLGLSIKNKENNFSFYAKEKWANDIGIKVGLVKRFGGGRFYDSTKCANTNTKRKAFIDSLKLEYKAVSKKTLSELDTVIARLREAMKAQEDFDNHDPYNYQKDMERAVQKKALFIKVSQKSPAELDAIVDRDFNKFDLKNNILHGYWAYWAALNGTYTNGSIPISNDTLVTSSVQRRFRSIPKFSIELTGNYQHDGIHHFFFGQISTRFNRGSFLENPLILEPKYKLNVVPNPIDTTAPIYEVKNGKELIGDCASLHDPVNYVDVGATGAWMSLFKKGLGLNAKANYQVPSANNADYYNFPKNWT